MAGAVYWVGADGNVWLKGSSGVQNLGSATTANYGLSDAGFESNTLKQSIQAQRIADPNAPATGAPTNPNGDSGAAATVLPDKSNDIALQNAGLSAIDQQTSTGIASIDKALGGLNGQYDTEKTTNEGSYTANSDQNQTNLQKNKQTALVNAAQGLQGLNGILSSIGALSGSGLQLRDRAVQQGANEDLSGAADNYGVNQAALDTSIGTFRQEDDRRRKEAATAADNARANVNNNAATNKLQAFKSLADDYSQMGDSANAQKYTGLAAALFPTIAATSVPNSDIAYKGAAFTPATLASYIAGANPTTVSTTAAAPGQQPGLIATTPQKKKQLATV